MKFSKKGDRGFTSLMGGQRVPKWSPRPEAYGTLDEASSALGMARTSARKPKTAKIILGIQKDLLLLGAELATEKGDSAKFGYRIDSRRVKRLERLMEELQAEVPLKREFIHPGETLSGAALDLARTIIRRGERRAADLFFRKMVSNPSVLQYLNRLADLLFILARYEEKSNPP